ncbi:FecR family protein [Zobellia uliginosa]|uniref:FecR family protein n=1 Tax=Zobellia uliginosa TaxID=143224 RepID=A0ABY1L664_9FLAO|nr:FecR family protein [Zobellia uliginosa]SIT13786.1 FecR family protein [Zobellia uliginosa]
MTPQEAEKYIIKYFTLTADGAELDLLNNWLAEEENQKIFKTYIKTHFAVNLAMNDPNLDKVREELLKEIRNDTNSKHKVRFLSILKYAAIALVFLGLGLALKNNWFDRETNNMVVPREDVITLELGNGEVQIISEDGSSKIVDETGRIIGDKKENQLVYKDNQKESTPEFNTLSIPNGKRFGIVLSDGTKVHLNAGSTLTYPIAFEKSEPRKVILTGEAYFEVSPDKKRQFVVNAQKLDIKVYGTTFNVTNYPEDQNTQVVLVEGSVSLSEQAREQTDKKEIFLQPGYMATFSKKTKHIVDKKVNTSLYTSWRNGNLVFRNETFNNIIQKLERHYNVVIINNNSKLANETFNATIETDHESIEQVFNYFNKVYRIEYQIVENKIIIN